MNPTYIVTQAHWEGNDLAVMARVRGVDADDITQATISSITLTVFELLPDGETIGAQVATQALTVADVVFDTLQTDKGWTSTTGYNFRAVVAGPTYFPDGGKIYRVQIRFTPTVGNPFHTAVNVPTLDVGGE